MISKSFRLCQLNVDFSRKAQSNWVLFMIKQRYPSTHPPPPPAPPFTLISFFVGFIFPLLRQYSFFISLTSSSSLSLFGFSCFFLLTHLPISALIFLLGFLFYVTYLHVYLSTSSSSVYSFAPHFHHVFLQSSAHNETIHIAFCPFSHLSLYFCLFFPLGVRQGPKRP